MRAEALVDLVSAVRSPERDTMKEAALAGKVEAYETLLSQLDYFAEQQLEAAKV